MLKNRSTQQYHAQKPFELKHTQKPQYSKTARSETAVLKNSTLRNRSTQNSTLRNRSTQKQNTQKPQYSKTAHSETAVLKNSTLRNRSNQKQHV